MVSAKHRLMAQEGHLASSSLLSGFEALAKIDYDRQGTVYNALFALSVGLERMMKIAVVLEHKATHNLANPTDKQLRALGHSIVDLYTKVQSAGNLRGINDGWFDECSDHYDILSALSEFAVASRYYNFDQLTKGTEDLDPLIRWFRVHLELAEHVLPNWKLERFMWKARSFCEEHGYLGWEWGPLGRIDLTIDVNYQVVIANATRGHCVWAIIEIIQPIYRLIELLTHSVQEMEADQGVTSTVPYMSEFFPFCLTNREGAIRRKSWTTQFHLGGR